MLYRFPCIKAELPSQGCICHATFQIDAKTTHICLHHSFRSRHPHGGTTMQWLQTPSVCCRAIASRTDGGEASDRAQELSRQDRSASHAGASTSGRDQAASVAAAVGLDQQGPAPLEARRPRSSLVSPCTFSNALALSQVVGAATMAMTIMHL